MNKLIKILMILFPIYWIYFVGFQYFSKYPEKFSNILNFSNFEFVIISIVLNFLILKYNPLRVFNKKYFSSETNGITIIFLIILSCLIAFQLTGFKQGIITQDNFISSMGASLAKIIYTIFSTLIVAFSVFTTGDFLLLRFFKNQSSLRYYLYASSMGIVSIVYAMFLAGSFEYLNPIIVSLILVLPLIINVKGAWNLLRNLTIAKISLKSRFNDSYIFLLATLLTTISYVLLNLLKAFPVGWDSSSLYMNISNLISQNAALISGFEAYNWSIFTSIGLIAFNNMPTTLTLSFLGGVWAMLMLFDISRRFLNEKQSLILTFIVFTLPSFMFLSIVDQKTDLGFLFFGLTSVSLILDYIGSKNKIKFLVLAGIISGFTFGIKYTALFLVIGLVSAIFYSNLGITGGIIALCLSLLFLFSFSLLEVRALEFGQSFKNSILVISGIGLISSFIYLIKNHILKETILILIKHSTIFGLFLFMAFSPWLIFNFFSLKSLSINNLLYGKSNIPLLDINKINREIIKKKDDDELINENIDIKEIPASDPTMIQNTGIKEELGRYAGYEKDSFRLFSIFYDVNIGTNVKGPIVDIGFLLLALLPLTSLFIVFSKLNWKKKPILIALTSLAFLIFLNLSFLIAKGFSECDQNIISCSIERINSTGVNIGNMIGLEVLSYIFFPIFWLFIIISNYLDSVLAITSVLIISLVLILPLYFSIDKKIKALAVILFSTLVLWLILGFGVYWYGIVTFTLLFLAIFLNIKKIQEQKIFIPNIGFCLKLIDYFLIFWMIISFFSIFNVKTGNHLLENSFVRYVLESKSQLDTLGLLNSSYKDGVVEINKKMDSKVYKIGSFLQFFIRDNNKRVLQDNQLDIFSSVNLNVNNKELIAKAFKSQGFEFIIYDLNAASIDKTKERTLTKKVESFENFLRDNKELELISTDRRYADENGDKEVVSGGKTVKYSNTVFGDSTKLLRQGSVAVYRIK